MRENKMENESSNSEKNKYPPMPKPKTRYNEWGFRKWIQTTSQKVNDFELKIRNMNLGPRARAIYQTAYFTDADGMEFVFISNAQFPCPMIYENMGLFIVPCFVPELLNGDISEDRQAAMMKRGKYIYDGWVSVEKWNKEKLDKIISTLDNLVNDFSMVPRLHARWEPKYYYEKTLVPSFFFSFDEFISLVKAIFTIEGLSGLDKQVISKSIAWIANGMREFAPVQRFLLLFISIESLATYIERHSLKVSPLREFAADKKSKTERKEKRESCIREYLQDESNLTEAIKKSYFDCVVGTRKMLDDHLIRVFNNDKVSMIMCRNTQNQKSLWNLRSDIAHGNLNLLSEDEVRFIETQLPKLEEIATAYIRKIMSKISNTTIPSELGCPIFTAPASRGIGMIGTEFEGPTDMAEYYADVELLSSSHIRVTF
jgi:hypothetical protein